MTSAVEVEAEAAVEPWGRLSGAMLLIQPIRELIRYLPFLIVLLFVGHASSGGPPWSLIGVAVVILRGVLQWFTTRYRITDSQLQLRKGLLRRRTLVTPLDRVRTVDVSSDPWQRVFSLAKVEIGTGTSDRKKEPFAIDGVAASRAATLRSELLHRAPVVAAGVADGVAASASDRTEPETVLARLRPRWVLYGPFTLSGAFTALFLVGLVWRVTSEAHLHPNQIAVVRSATHHLSDTPSWIDAIQICLVAIVVVGLLSAAGYLLSFWGFELSRHAGGSLHMKRGLLTTRATSLEERRLRGVELSEPLLLRAVHGARALAIATGLRVGRGAERGGTVLLPPAPEAEAIQVAGEVLRDATPLTCELRAHPAVAHRRRYTRAAAGALVVVAVAALLWWQEGLPGWVPLASLILLPLSGPLAQDRARSLGHQVLRDEHAWLVTRFGSLTRRRCVLAVDGVIGVTLRQSFFQRRAGVVTLVATTAAGRQRYPVTDLGEAQAEDLARELLPGLLDQFA